MTNKLITVAYGDGIGPEIMDATLHILKEAGAPLHIETIEVGKAIYEKGFTAGIMPSAWEALEHSRVFLKAPITTPQGGGYKSLNVTMRKKLGLYANIRPAISYHPFVSTNFAKMNVVVVRENEEDLYAGIEYRDDEDSYSCLKVITRQGSEKIIRYAFDYAMENNRRKISCFSKDNIMKMTDGIFHKVFDEIAKEYPTITTDHYIVDIGTAKLAADPERFDVIVTSNLYGDIISDVAAEITGSVGLAGSANIGRDYAMFEAIHGSAPLMAGKNTANPSGLLLSSVMMLVHLKEYEVASRIHNAWLATIEQRIHTKDIYQDGNSAERVGTKEFAKAVVANLGQLPSQLKPAEYKPLVAAVLHPSSNACKVVKKELCGVDIFIDSDYQGSEAIAIAINKLDLSGFELCFISAKGLKIWPYSGVVSNPTRQLWLRFRALDCDYRQILTLLDKLSAIVEIVKTQNIYSFDGIDGFSMAQGE